MFSASSRFAAAAVAVVAMLGPGGVEAKTPVPLTRAHAHNDYEHRRPLFDALDCGFCSVEADVFLVDGKLLVGHTRSALKSERTLESLYLEPLQQRVAENGGRVYRGGPVFTLFIDIKSDGQSTYAILRRVLEQHADLFSGLSESGFTRRAIDVVVSGERPVTAIAADVHRRVGIDGRLADLDSDKSPDLMPIISDNWRLHFNWRGTGPIPENDRAKLRSIVKQAHHRGRRVRFWATPDQPAVWDELWAAGVDLINADDLDGLARFLVKR